MAEDRTDTVRTVSRVAAVVSFLGGVAIIGVMLLLLTLFTSRGFISELVHLIHDPVFLLFILSGAAAMVLAPFIWREQIWAILGSLAMSGAYLFLFGNETQLLKWSLTATTVLLAACAVVRLWLGPSAAR